MQTAQSTEARLDFPAIARSLKRFESYSINSDFLTPTDGWHVSFGSDESGDTFLKELGTGLRVDLYVGDKKQLSGYLDEIDISHDRGGTKVELSGRDLVAPVVSGCIDPTTKFTPGQTLAEVLETVFKPFGVTKFEVDDGANVGILTGQTRATRVSKKGKPLKSYVLHQLKPYPNEGAWAFASRITQRHGLWMWLGADGETLYVGKPNFEQEPLYTIERKRSGTLNRVLSGRVKYSATDQPLALVCTGRGAGGEHARSGMRIIAVNEAVTGDALPALIARYPGAKVIGYTSFPWPKYQSPFVGPLFMHDDQSATPEQLENFARRELALRQRKAFEASYTVYGHEDALTGAAWTVNTMVHVRDDVLGIDEPLWILGRTFNKSRSGGTTTDLQLIRPNTLEF